MAAHNPTSSKHLEDQAAAAALYVTEPQKQARDIRKEANYPLDANGKLTSAGAATSLKRAEAKDLPSFPSVGIAQSAAGGAAGLAAKNTQSPEWWKPEASAGASKAALIANEYKMKPLWQPEASAAGSKAAILAAQKGHGLNLWEPSASDKALIAATGAASGQKGGQVGKAPKTVGETGLAERYPDERNAAKNALSAATSVHGGTRSRNNDLPGYTDEEADKIRQQATVKGLNSALFGSNPLIGPELQEQQHQASLHAAAVTMAQGMYGKRDQAYREKIAAARAEGRRLEDDSDDEESPMSFMGLHEAATKLANERLAKLQDPNAAYREHYGTNSPPPKSRLSMFGGGSLRKKDSDEDMSDEKKSRKIRGEMNLFNDKLKEIDARKRTDDRSALLAAAQRNVKALSAEMDEDVFQRTGKMSPAMKADWEAQARARAQAASEERTANFGKVAIGGGAYLDQTEVDAIAQKRLQPTLDAITAKAAHDREVDEQNRLAEEEQKRIEAENKEQEKYQNMKIKEQWKRFRSEEKAEEQAHKQEEKDAKMQEKFEHDKQKEEEAAIKAAEKERERQQKEEWKAFKEQEKQEEKARKENRGSVFGSIFRRKSKKEKEPESKAETTVPASHGTTTTTISAGAPDVAAGEEAVSHDKEPHHSPLAALEATPEAKAANKQKPGGSLLSVLKHKKEEHDEQKRHSHAESATAGAATGAVAGAAVAHETGHTGKDEPGKAQPSTGTPAAEALAPEHTETETVAPVTTASTGTAEPVTAATTSQPATTEERVVPASTTGATITDSNVDRAEKPAVHDAGHTSIAAADVPTSPTEFHDASAEPLVASTTEPTASATEAPIAMGSDKPVTSEINHSKIVDTLDPRANVGKPGFTGSEKLASATADMRGTDHAGASAAAAEKAMSANEAAQTASAGPGTATAQTSAQDAAAKPAVATHEGDKVEAPIAERIAVPAEAAAAAEDATESGGKHGTPRQAEQKKQNRLSGYFKSKLGKVKQTKGSDAVTITPTTQYTTMGKYVDPNDRHSTNSAAAVASNAAALEAASGSGTAGDKAAISNAQASSAAHPSAAQASTTGATSSTSPVVHMEPAADADASAIAVDPAFTSAGTSEARGRVGGKLHSEDNDEARDTVAEQLPLPKVPGLPRASESPARDSRFKEELFG